MEVRKYHSYDKDECFYGDDDDYDYKFSYNEENNLSLLYKEIENDKYYFDIMDNFLKIYNENELTDNEQINSLIMTVKKICEIKNERNTDKFMRCTYLNYKSVFDLLNKEKNYKYHSLISQIWLYIEGIELQINIEETNYYFWYMLHHKNDNLFDSNVEYK